MTPEHIEALADLPALLDAEGHSVVIIGAFAREATFDRAIERAPPRRTLDARHANLNAVEGLGVPIRNPWEPWRTNAPSEPQPRNTRMGRYLRYPTPGGVGAARNA